MASFLEDGFSSTVTFSLNNAVKLKEKTVQPPGVDGGAPLEITTMRNTTYRTMAARKLLTLVGAPITARYDPAVYSQIIAMINVNQQIKVTFPDNSFVQYWGHIQKFDPAALAEGAVPLATVTLVASNKDNTGAEAAPTFG